MSTVLQIQRRKKNGILSVFNSHCSLNGWMRFQGTAYSKRVGAHRCTRKASCGESRLSYQTNEGTPVSGRGIRLSRNGGSHLIEAECFWLVDCLDNSRRWTASKKKLNYERRTVEVSSSCEQIMKALNVEIFTEVQSKLISRKLRSTRKVSVHGQL